MISGTTWLCLLFLSQRVSCPKQLRTLSDFTACVETLPMLYSEEKWADCNFEDGTSCRFQAISPRFYRGKLPSRYQYTTLAELSGRAAVFHPKGTFLYAYIQATAGAAEEIAIATSITCQSDNGILNFDYWLLGDQSANLRVCTQDGQARSCTKPIVYTEVPMVAVEVIRPKSPTFVVEIVVSNITRPTVFIIDNINYKATLCGDTVEVNDVRENRKDALKNLTETISDENSNLIPPHSLTKEAPQEGSHEVFTKSSKPCKLIPCDFGNGTCGYINYRNNSMKLGEWRLDDKRVKSTHTGYKVADDSNTGFLYVGTENPSLGVATYILESPEFSVSRDMRLSFDVYRRSREITLQVCLNSPFNCPYTISPYDNYVNWKQGETLTIPKLTKKIFFKALQWRKFKWLAIDNIELSPCSHAATPSEKP
ncbi:hypothetical protein Q1695_003628 [Nippostrongylus brasiliensis]|nr:hypothetical protein Q1695_003628 [Nippostrongylus brasiliensis]